MGERPVAPAEPARAPTSPFQFSPEPLNGVANSAKPKDFEALKREALAQAAGWKARYEAKQAAQARAI